MKLNLKHVGFSRLKISSIVIQMEVIMYFLRSNKGDKANRSQGRLVNK